MPFAGFSTWVGCGAPAAVEITVPVSTVIPARARTSFNSAVTAAPRGRGPGRTSHVATLLSWMKTFGSATTPNRSFTTSPVTMPFPPQW